MFTLIVATVSIVGGAVAGAKYAETVNSLTKTVVETVKNKIG